MKNTTPKPKGNQNPRRKRTQDYTPKPVKGSRMKG